MELLILSTLKWRMQTVTPFSFIDSFLHMINGDKDPSRTLLLQAIKLLSSTNKGTYITFFKVKLAETTCVLCNSCVRLGIELLEFRSSEVAGALALFLTDGDKSFPSIGRYLDKVTNLYFTADSISDS